MNANSNQSDPTIQVVYLGITLTTMSADAALDVAECIARRAFPAPPQPPPASAFAAVAHPVNPPADGVDDESPIDRVLAALAHPARRKHLTLLHTVRAADGRYVPRDDLADDLGLSGAHAGNQLGGIVTAIGKIATAAGLDAEPLIQRSSLGFCATSTLLAMHLPHVTGAANSQLHVVPLTVLRPTEARSAAPPQAAGRGPSTARDRSS
ncbi:MAG: hypothetical protein ACHREM_03860 [Polyangiales bacterium]